MFSSQGILVDMFCVVSCLFTSLHVAIMHFVGLSVRIFLNDGFSFWCVYGGLMFSFPIHMLSLIHSFILVASVPLGPYR